MPKIRLVHGSCQKLWSFETELHEKVAQTRAQHGNRKVPLDPGIPSVPNLFLDEVAYATLTHAVQFVVG